MFKNSSAVVMRKLCVYFCLLKLGVEKFCSNRRDDFDSDDIRICKKSKRGLDID